MNYHSYKGGPRVPARYQYKPLLFYLAVFTATWFFWFGAILLRRSALSTVFMLLGLISPAVIALIMVFGSGSAALKQDFRQKLCGLCRLRPLYLLCAVLVFAAVVTVSILLSTLFGQGLDQFAFAEGFSFSGAGASALLTILLASIIEEVGWRGYGEDAIAFSCSWLKESLLFGCLWALWHLPLFWIRGTYHAGLRHLGAPYMLNFLFSVFPLGFLTTWVYVKNGRSMLACIIFHLFVNIMQEKIALTPVTKCVETFVVTVAAVLVVLANRDLFLETRHVGRLLEEKVGD